MEKTRWETVIVRFPAVGETIEAGKRVYIVPEIDVEFGPEPVKEDSGRLWFAYTAIPELAAELAIGWAE